MGAAENRAKNSKMASDLKARGIFHGKRMTKPTHCNYPKPNEVGSAAYRRLLARGMKTVKSETSSSDLSTVMVGNKKAA